MWARSTLRVGLCAGAIRSLTGQTLNWPFEHHGLKSLVQGQGDGSPSPSSIAQGNALFIVFPLPAISSLVIYMGVSSKYQGQDRAPANEPAQTLLQASTKCLSLEAGD